MVFPNVLQNLCEQIRDLDLPKRERLSFNAQNQMLHLECKRLWFNGELGTPTAFDHELAGSVAVELRYGAEEVEEVLSVFFIEGGDEACVNEDDLGDVTL